MSRVLTQQNFRYVNGQVAVRQPISVVYRGTSSLVPLWVAITGSGTLSNPRETDAQGNVAFYVESGSYDFLALGARTPFDALEPGSGGSDSFFEFVQSTPASTWTVSSPFSRPAAVAVIVDDELVLADVEYAGDDTIVVTHAVPTAGKVILT